MTVDEIAKIAATAIASNFPVRNTHVFTNHARQMRVVAARRHTLKEWLAVLRAVRNPDNAARIQVATNVGPLMAHDLRRRVILAALGFLE